MSARADRAGLDVLFFGDLAIRAAGEGLIEDLPIILDELVLAALEVLDLLALEQVGGRTGRRRDHRLMLLQLVFPGELPLGGLAMRASLVAGDRGHPAGEVAGTSIFEIVELLPHDHEGLLRELVGVGGDEAAREEAVELLSHGKTKLLAGSQITAPQRSQQIVEIHAHTLPEIGARRLPKGPKSKSRPAPSPVAVWSIVPEVAEDPKSGEGPKAGAISPEAKPADPSYWSKLLEEVRNGWVLEHIGSGTRHRIGRFEGIRLLGEGGYGLVLLVRDPELDREVALKLCRVPHPGAEAAILREAQLLAKIDHPNVITVHEIGHYGDDVFYVMERIVGMNGYRFIQHCQGWRQALEVYIGAGTGLAAAHGRGIIHGDFKPGNVLIPDDGGPVRVVDFGLARVMYQDGAGLRHRLGTLPYMAPEVLRGSPGDAQSDQWSFCVALSHTLEAELPFEGETVTELLASITSGRPREGDPSVPERVREVLRVGLSIDPAGRYPDMQTLLHELGKLLQPPTPKSAVSGGDESRTEELSERLLNLPQPAVGGVDESRAEEPSAEPKEHLLSLPQPPAAGTRRRGLGYTFAVALLGGAVPTVAMLVLQRPAATPIVEPSLEVEVVFDPFAAIMEKVREDDFEQAETLWLETWSSPKVRELSDGESLDVARACLGRAERLKDSDGAKAKDAVKFARVVGTQLQTRGRDAGDQILNEIARVP